MNMFTWAVFLGGLVLGATLGVLIMAVVYVSEALDKAEDPR